MKNKNKLVLASICVLIIIHIAFVHCNKKYIEPLDNNSSDSDTKPKSAILKGKYINGKWCMDVVITFTSDITYGKKNTKPVYEVIPLSAKTTIDTTCLSPLTMFSRTCCPSNKPNKKIGKLYSDVDYASNTKIKGVSSFSNSKLCDRSDTNTTISGLTFESTDTILDYVGPALTFNGISIGTQSIPIEKNEAFKDYVYVTDATNISAPPPTGFMYNAPFFTYLVNKFNASNYSLDVGNGQIIFNDSIISSSENPGKHNKY